MATLTVKAAHKRWVRAQRRAALEELDTTPGEVSARYVAALEGERSAREDYVEARRSEGVRGGVPSWVTPWAFGVGCALLVLGIGVVPYFT